MAPKSRRSRDCAGTSGDDDLRASLREVGRADGIADVRRLAGGVIADAWLITWVGGRSAVGKIVNGAAPGLFRTEADGLAALRGTGQLATPDVLAVTDRLLLLEALPPRDDSAGSWEAFGRDMAGAHRAVVSDRFGWPADGWLGRLRQVNAWNADGHVFFAENRLLRYLTEALAEQALTVDDRRAVERLCARLPELVPSMPAVLTHGDLWTGNLVSRRAAGSPSSTRPCPAPGPRSTCPCSGATHARPLPTGSSPSTRSSTPRHPDGRTDARAAPAGAAQQRGALRPRRVPRPEAAPRHPRAVLPEVTASDFGVVTSNGPGSQDSVTGGAGGPAVSHACRALISGPGFFLDLGNDRLLVNSSPQPDGPPDKARSMIGLKSFTFSVSSHRLSALAHANISSSALARKSGRSATAITS